MGEHLKVTDQPRIIILMNGGMQININSYLQDPSERRKEESVNTDRYPFGCYFLPCFVSYQTHRNSFF